MFCVCVCVCVSVCLCVLVSQLCLTLCDPVDYSPPGFSVHRVLQTRILEWLAIPSPEDLPRNWTQVSHIASRFFTIWATREALKDAYLVIMPLQTIMWEAQIWSLGWEDLLKKGMATYSSILAGEFYEQRSLVGYRPWGHKESDTTEWLTHSLEILARILAWILASPICSPHQELYNTTSYWSYK